MSRGWLPVLVLVASAEAAPPRAKIPPACRGTSLDLRALEATCAAPESSKGDLPPGVTASIAPNPVRVPTGTATDAAIVFTNTGSAAADLYFSVGCDPRDITLNLNGPNDKESIPTDRQFDNCLDDTFCAGRYVHVVLEPRGSARAGFKVDARYSKMCRESRFGHLPPGRYDLMVRSYSADSGSGVDRRWPFGELHSSVIVTK